MNKSKLLSRSALFALPVALAVAGCQTAPANSGGGAVQGSDLALETAQSAKQDAMRNQTAIATLRDEISRAADAAERAANAAERAAEEAKAAADKADRIFQRQIRK